MSLTKVSYSMIQGAAVSAEDYGFSTSASGATNAAAIQSAITHINSVAGGYGGTVYLPRGVYAVAPDVISLATSHFITLRGAAAAFGYDTPYAATQLVFSAGTVGIDGYDPTLVLAQGNKICDLLVSGADVLSIGIKVNDNHTLEDLSITRCVNAGIVLADYTNSASLNRVSSYGNSGGGGTGYGVLVEGTNTTIWSITNSNFRANKIGLGIKAGSGFTVAQTVVESNDAEGVSIYRPDAATPVFNGNFNCVWLENNYRNGGTGYSLVLDSAVLDSGTSTPVQINFTQCSISTGGSAKHLNINSGRGITFDTCTMSGGSFSDGVLLNSTWALEIYLRGRNQLAGTSASGRNFSAAPTAFIASTSYNSTSNRTFNTSKLVTQLSGTGPTTIFTVSHLTDGDYGTVQVDLAGVFNGSDYGYRSYLGLWYKVGGSTTLMLSPVNIDASATSKLSGNNATITGTNSSGDLLIQLTLAAFSGGNNFVGTVQLTFSGGQSDPSIV